MLHFVLYICIIWFLVLPYPYVLEIFLLSDYKTVYCSFSYICCLRWITYPAIFRILPRKEGSIIHCNSSCFRWPMPNHLKICLPTLCCALPGWMFVVLWVTKQPSGEWSANLLYVHMLSCSTDDNQRVSSFP